MLQEVKAMASTVEARQNEQSSEGGRRKPRGSRRSGGDPPTCFRCGQVGHLRIGCRNAPIDRNSTGGNTGRTPENGDPACDKGQSEVLNMKPQTTENVKSAVAEKLVGQMNEGTAIINGCKTNALIDTGSQVTTILKDFYDQHLTDCDIHPVETLKVVGAGGQDVPFFGFSVNISFPEHEAGICEETPTFALIVPNTTYNQRVPAVIGTNVLRHYANKYDHRNKTGGAQTASSQYGT